MSFIKNNSSSDSAFIHPFLKVRLPYHLEPVDTSIGINSKKRIYTDNDDKVLIIEVLFSINIVYPAVPFLYFYASNTFFFKLFLDIIKLFNLT